MENISMNLNSRVENFSKIVSGTKCNDLLKIEIDLETAMRITVNKLIKLRFTKNMLYIVGNGGSAAVASHALIDFIKVGKINAQVLHEPSLLTCLANDIGYENAYSHVLANFIKPGDILIAISSSGKSSNICNAAEVAKMKEAEVITFSGFSESNQLKNIGNLNFWLESEDYGFVEVGHQFILHNLSDRLGEEEKNTKLKENFGQHIEVTSS